MDAIQISINKEPSFNEVWYHGTIIVKNKEYDFWLIHPQGEDENGRIYSCEVRWFFHRVPVEVREMYPIIIETYIESLNEKT
jgi:hypothetical protein